MRYEQIDVEVREEVALITLNRPDRMNAWTYQMNRELVHAIAAANDDAEVGAIIVTGAGRGFCAGADVSETFEPQIEGETSGGPLSGDWVQLIRGSKPIVAAVNGATVGVGLTMILSFDVIVAAESAKFGMFFVKMGVVPELASTNFLVQRMGFGRASEMCLSGRLYSGAEAHEAGLADHLAPDDACLEKALEIARSMGCNPPPQLRWIKELLTQNACEADLAKVQQREFARLGEAYGSPEHREAVRAFREKRPPNFR